MSFGLSLRFLSTEMKFSEFSAKDVPALSETHDLCIGGDCFEMLLQTSAVPQVIPFVKVCNCSN